MCGIAGFYNPKMNYSENPKNNINILNNMIKTMKMRGPDANGYSIINSCCLAHTRLSIIDIENGSQPMTIRHNENTYHIIFNGEIYNHKIIRKKLKDKGFVFNSNSDTEVIGYAFVHWGADFVKELNGIFAIAIYDEFYNTLYLFRDHFGVKPLYYTQIGDTIIFASRIDTLFEYPRVRPSLSMDGFNEIFTLGPAKTYGHGVFSGIDELLPGQYYIISPYYKIKKIYYRIESKPHEDDEATTVEKTRQLLIDSIKQQMISDVPICTFLSGGLDSSLVSSVCAKNIDEPEKLKTYSFDFYDNDKHFVSNSFQKSLDKPYIDIMIEYLNSDHTYLKCGSSDMYSMLYDSVDSRCLPTMADIDSSLLFFCKKVSMNHKVTLTGECADEIFGGYPWFHRNEMIYSDAFPWMPDLSFKKSLLNPEFAAALHMEKYVRNAYNKTISEINILPEDCAHETKLKQICYLNIRWFMQTLLDRMDRTSMNYGLEARVPFADKNIVDYVFNVPWKLKIKNNQPKYLLMKASEGLLPNEIIYRAKNPYPKTYNPEYEKILIARMREIINDSASPIKSYLNINAINSFLDSPKEYGKPWYGQLMAGPQMIAYLIQIDYWMRKYSLSL